MTFWEWIVLLCTIPLWGPFVFYFVTIAGAFICLGVAALMEAFRR